jgi:hypothetical protein
MRNFKMCTLHQLLFRMTKSRRVMWAGHVAGIGTMRNAYKILVGKPDLKRPLRRPTLRLDYNIKMDV